MASLVGFNYVIELVPDNSYGALNVTSGEWNGLVKGRFIQNYTLLIHIIIALMEDRADLAIGDLTINWAREEVVDFTKPFMNLGISILYKIPSGKPTRLFSFMNPLAVEIWM